MRDINLDRTSAELLVDLLEEADPKEVGSWRDTIADQIREEFGMLRRENQPGFKRKFVPPYDCYWSKRALAAERVLRSLLPYCHSSSDFKSDRDRVNDLRDEAGKHLETVQTETGITK